MKSVYAGETAPIILLAWGTGDADPDQFNRGVLSSKGMFSQISYPELDALLEKIVTEMDPEKRRALIAKQRAFEAENFPVIYILQLGVLGGVGEKLKDWDMQADARRRTVSPIRQEFALLNSKANLIDPKIFVFDYYRHRLVDFPDIQVGDTLPATRENTVSRLSQSLRRTH